MTEYDELRKKLLELEQKLADSIAECYMKLNAVKDEEWPKVGDVWFTCIEDGTTCKLKWDGNVFDMRCKLQNNCYRTREEAEAKAKWLSDQRTEARFRLEQLDGFDVNGEYEIFYSEQLLIGAVPICNYGGITFKTKAQAEYAMTHHAADLLLVLTNNAK